ncbi:MAG TPA: hypothetical protein VI456_15670 [Polyangia bacterium]
MPTPRAWLVAFLITVAVEAPIVVALTRDVAARAPRRFLLAVFAQLATHPLVWFIFPRLVGLTGRTSMLLSELWAWLAEAAFYALVFPGLPATRALGVSALANGASVAAGLLLGGVIRALSV